ncbi:hypothetical protein [Ornithinibacillus halotolerans]|uniref:Uncharacterized protein n=1 Tax=Ornithinibacillus halotolerans TaxID=1274357 RepID=A0A916RTY9_9BACI|nr:hypothetical protein [Ornithinibacillus halotolerans]GGA70392.1 hypothetical protein GCM10008025_12850 [Ornithinibacillus halotolerans]
MESYNGIVFQGDIEQNSFYLTMVKNITTASSLTKDQLVKMISYLEEQHDSCYITVNDQIPILLEDADRSNLLNDLEEILQQLQGKQ